MIKIKDATFTLSFETSASTAASASNPFVNGIMRMMSVDMPSFANGLASGDVYLYTLDGTVVFGAALSAEKPGSSRCVTGYDIPICGGETVQIKLVTAPSGAATDIDLDATVVFFVDTSG